MENKRKLKFKNGTEYQLRKKIFKKTHDMIEAHNKKKGHSYRLGHNQFSHMVISPYKGLRDDLIDTFLVET